MTDKEKIRAEVERLKMEYDKESIFRTVRGDTAREVFGKLLSFIDSIPEEPVNEDLDDEIVDWCNHLDYVDFDYEAIRDAARHIANWQKEQMMQKAVEATVCEMSEQHGRMVCAWFGCKTEEYYDLDDEVKVIIIKED